MTLTKRKYVPNLPSMQATCERNYVHLMRLLPDCDTESMSYQFAVGNGLKYKISIVDSSRYTSTLQLEQVQARAPVYLQPVMTVRLYHDARMAEVVSSQNVGALAPSYDYPNAKMRLRNEKHMVNQFLSEWIGFCINTGRPTTLSC